MPLTSQTPKFVTTKKRIEESEARPLTSLPEPITGVRMIVWMLVFEVAAGIFLLKAIIRRSEVNTREKLLEIEYRLAELAEKVKAAEK